MASTLVRKKPLRTWRSEPVAPMDINFSDLTSGVDSAERRMALDMFSNLDASHREARMSYNANDHLVRFHGSRVLVNDDALSLARQRRQANRDRLKKGLDAAKEPQALEHVAQGSYAMCTMVQAESESSDIDDGVVFSREALKGHAAEIEPPTTPRKWCALRWLRQATIRRRLRCVGIVCASTMPTGFTSTCPYTGSMRRTARPTRSWRRLGRGKPLRQKTSPLGSTSR